jgi:hypothetical protein
MLVWFIKQTDQEYETEGLERGGLEGEGEGRVRRDYSLFEPKLSKCRFIVPPAFALMNYMRSGMLLRFFSQTGIFLRVFLICY